MKWGRNKARASFEKSLESVRKTSSLWTFSFTEIEEPHRAVLLGATAGAAYTFGAYAEPLLENRVHEQSERLELPQGTIVDRTVQFTRALTDPDRVEAAYRVITWSLVARVGESFWGPHYAEGIEGCAGAFAFRSEPEQEVVDLGRPPDGTESVEAQAHRDKLRVYATLTGAYSVAIGERVTMQDHFLGSVQIAPFLDCMLEGVEVAGETIELYAPYALDDLPIQRH